MLNNYKFSDKEIADLLNSAIILIDTREKDTFQKRLFNEYCASCFIKTENMKLPFGDYGVKVPKNEPSEFLIGFPSLYEYGSSTNVIAGLQFLYSIPGP